MRNLSDHSLVLLPEPAGAYALLTKNPKEAEVAVVFVHGFFGNARTTWRNFQGLVDELGEQYPWWARCDLYFYSYESRNQVKPLAEELRVFVHRILSTREIFSIPELGNDSPRQYEHLVFVGHSPGALIIREAVLQEIRAIEPNLSAIAGTSDSSIPSGTRLFLNASVRLFAPAHSGAMCSGWLAIASNAPVFEILTALILRSRPLYQNILPGSPVLVDIRRETEEFHKKYGVQALTAQSLFGEKDAVVFMGKYAHDLDYPTEPGHSHTSICKPHSSLCRPKKRDPNDFTKPLEFVTHGDLSKAATR